MALPPRHLFHFRFILRRIMWKSSYYLNFATAIIDQNSERNLLIRFPSILSLVIIRCHHRNLTHTLFILRRMHLIKSEINITILTCKLPFFIHLQIVLFLFLSLSTFVYLRAWLCVIRFDFLHKHGHNTTLIKKKRKPPTTGKRSNVEDSNCPLAKI